MRATSSASSRRVAVSEGGRGRGGVSVGLDISP
jgi:hypothetical protein